MPYRVLCRLVAARLRSTRSDRDEGYPDAREFLAAAAKKPGLSARRCGEAVAVVGGDAGKRKRALIDGLLRDAGCSTMPGS